MPAINKLEQQEREDWLRENYHKPNARKEMAEKFGIRDETISRYMQILKQEKTEIQELANALASQKLAILKVGVVDDIKSDIESSKIADQRIWSLIATLKEKIDNEENVSANALAIKSLIDSEIKNREVRTKLYKTIDDLIGIKPVETQVNIQNNFQLKWGDGDNAI
jgi:hypothetical protein